jgi:hypothetical protein
VVSTGFIDGHVHVVEMPLGQRLILRDGVTTSLALEFGKVTVGRRYDAMAAALEECQQLPDEKSRRLREK